jgi:RNA polymerase sigma-70 factor (ECF subfamily)
MNALQQDEQDIIMRCRAGDGDAYAVLVDRYRSLAYTVACRMLGDAETANDVAQESFLSAYEGLRHFRFGSKFSSWLTSIVLNKCRDLLRSRRPTVDIEEIAEIRETGRRDPEEEASAGESADAVQKALNSLPPDYREAVILKHIEELDYQTMSEILGVSIAALKVRTHRGREMLKGLLERSGVTP